MNTFIFRFNKPVRYGDVSVEEYEQRFIDVFISRKYTDVVMVQELGEEGTNLHWHGRFSTKREMSAVRKDLNSHFDLSGNEEFSLKSWDPTKADQYHRYLAKGPVSQRLVMPRVVIDDLGLMWDRLHHAFHDEKLARESRSRKGSAEKKTSFMDDFIALCRVNGSKTRNEIFETFRSMFSRRVHQIDPFVADKLCWTAYCAVNPVEGFDTLKSSMRFFN